MIFTLDCTLLRLLVAVFATWRLSVFIYHGHEFKWLRDIARTYAVDDCGIPKTFWGRQLACFWCVTTWVGTFVSPVVFVSAPVWILLIPFALSGAALLLSGGGRTIWRTMQE